MCLSTLPAEGEAARHKEALQVFHLHALELTQRKVCRWAAKQVTAGCFIRILQNSLMKWRPAAMRRTANSSQMTHQSREP